MSEESDQIRAEIALLEAELTRTFGSEARLNIRRRIQLLIIELAQLRCVTDVTLFGPGNAYSLRLARSVYTGPAVNVRRDSDNTTLDIGFVSGVLDTASLLAFVGAGNGYVTTWYDQALGFDFVQATAANQPQIVASGALVTLDGTPTGTPAIKFVAANSNSLVSSVPYLQYFFSSGTVIVITTFNATTIAATDAAVKKSHVLFGDSSHGFLVGISNVSSNPSFVASSNVQPNASTICTATIAPCAAGTTYVAIGVFKEYDTFSAYLNGGAGASTPETHGFAQLSFTPVMAIDASGTVFYDGLIAEMFIYGDPIAPASLDNMASDPNIGSGGNLATYAGVTWTPIS